MEVNNLYKNYQKNSKKFIALLFRMLYEQGVYFINQKEIEEKLFYYFKNPNYQELFSGINPNNSMKRLNLEKEIDYEKNNQKKVFKIPNVPEKLFLRYGEDERYYEWYFSPQEINLIKRITYELSMQHQFEIFSCFQTTIYSTLPEKLFTLFRGKRYNDIIEWTGITDGVVKPIDWKDSDVCILCQDPGNTYKKVLLQEQKVQQYEIEDASFMIQRGTINGKIKNIKIYTGIQKFSFLEKMMELSSIEDVSNWERKDSIKQLLLK